MARKTLKVTNPYTLKGAGTYTFDGFAGALQKVKKAERAFEKWKAVPLSNRIAHIQKALEYFKINQNQIAKDISNQMGKPLSQSFNELNGFFERANYLTDVAPSVLTPDILPAKPGFHREIQHAPLGIIFVISAWNYPLLISVNGVLAALLAGNTVLLKHSSQTPAVGKHFEKAFGAMGGISHVLQTVVLDHASTGRLIEKAPIAHVVFTGSVSGGKTILKHTSKRFIATNLELGGKDGAYVASDADVAHAAATLVDGAMYNAGQSCCGIERVYVHGSVYNAFVEEVLKNAKQYILGDPMKEGTTMGPLAQAKSAKVMLAQILEAKRKKAKILLGGGKKKIGNATFFEPTVLVNVTPTMSVMREENFGPILPIMKVQSDEQAASLVKDSRYGLTAAIFTADQKRAERFADQIDVGTVFMNRCDYLDPALPWTGVRDSGLGSTLSPYGFHALTRRKAIHFKLNIKG